MYIFRIGVYGQGLSRPTRYRSISRPRDKLPEHEDRRASRVSLQGSISLLGKGYTNTSGPMKCEAEGWGWPWRMGPGMWNGVDEVYFFLSFFPILVILMSGNAERLQRIHRG